MIEVSEEDFSIAEVANGLKDERAGAVVMFLGVVKGYNEGMRVNKLYIEAYKEMAKAKLQEIRDEAIGRFGIIDATIIHRVGLMMPGDNIVVIGVSAISRKEGFEACSWILEKLKKEAPFWKKEITEGGERWVKDV